MNRWIGVQQKSWDRLHPGQQTLLNDLGITPHTPVGRQPTPATRVYPPSPGLGHARAYAIAHGHLTPDKHTRHEGFPLGRWLGQQRRKARTGGLSSTTTAVLTSLDPWWNPPWPYTWHRTWCRYQAAVTDREPVPDTLQHWAALQHAQWNRLHPDQQQLLTTTGIKAPAHGPPP
ncbi:helicase associated domain-containing protein [Streptomyces sp. NPDC091027]|uniref:helicase associated domain-containing protein n=1 Tax=Streptomyces sp. NPDC091027 TaxID=3365971 RepID=UPI0037F3292A